MSNGKPKYLSKLFGDFEVEKSPEEIESEAHAEAEELIKQQSNFNTQEDMYYDDVYNRYYSDSILNEGDGMYDSTPEQDQILMEQHEAEVDPELFVDAEGDVAEVEHTDMEGNPIHPEVVKQALYDEWLSNKYYSDGEDEDEEMSEEEQEAEVVKQALFEEYLSGRLFSAYDMEDYAQTVLQSAYDEAEAESRYYADQSYGYEPITYFYADDEEGQEVSEAGDKAQQLTEDDETPAVEVVDQREETKTQSGLDFVEAEVTRMLDN